ncbi:MAG: hypothetical protein DSY91_06050 [Deltaproteobacteria bacterium]|nr:MAG: hypothetical protein DSY91_06050 [Deltaproteobacteria bacterium]
MAKIDRSSGSSRRLRLGTNAFLYSIVVLAILVVIQLIAYRHTKRFDLTESKIHSLSPQTVKVLKNIKEDVTIKAFMREGQDKEKAAELLDLYAYHSKKIHPQIIDPDRHPGEAKQYEVKNYGTLVFLCGKRKEKILQSDEEAITNALIKVTQKKKKKIYFLTGHGEKDLKSAGKTGYSKVKKSLEEKNYEVKSLLLTRNEGVPKDADVLVIADPQVELLQHELTALKAYLKRGGHLLVMLNPYTSVGLVNFLKDYGFIVGNDMIVDKLSRILGGGYLMPVVASYGPHPITRNFNMMTFYPTARSVKVMKGRDAEMNWNLTVLAKTGEASWGETDRKLLEEGKAKFDKGQDLKGPVPLAAVCEVTPEGMVKLTGKLRKKRRPRLVVVGDPDFVENSYFGLYGNGIFFLNMVNWLAEKDVLIAIPPKNPENQPLTLTRNQGLFSFWINVVAIPLIIIIIGFVVFIRRRITG